MAFPNTPAVAVCTALILGGCSYVEDALFPSSDEGGARTAERIEVYPSRPAAPAPAVSAVQAMRPTPAAARDFDPPLVEGGGAGQQTASTGTFVGGKVSALRQELQQLHSTLNAQEAELEAIRGETVADSQRYHGTVAAINARLQVGTTPGNPVLVQQWKEAQAELDEIGDDILQMNRLATEVSSTSTLAAYLLNSVRAALGLSGAVEEDHRQLQRLADDVNRMLVSIERLLNDLSADISRQQQYLTNERGNLNTMAVAIQGGQLYSSNLANRAGSTPGAAVAQASSVATAPSPLAPGRPLVVIRFDKPNVPYESALYTAVRSALERRPGATFDVIAVSPVRGSPGQTALAATTARRNAESVLRSLTGMGLPANRVRLSQQSSDQASTGEVQIFVR